MATTSPIMEWQVLTQRQRADNHLLGCLPPGMGSNVQWDADQRSMVRTEEDMAHQLLGNASSLLDSSDVPEGPVGSLSAAAAGQYHCSGLHQQST